MSIKNVINTGGFYLEREIFTEYYEKRGSTINATCLIRVQKDEDEHWESWQSGEEFNNLNEVLEFLKNGEGVKGNTLKDFGYHITGTDRVWELQHDGGYGITIKKNMPVENKKLSYDVEIYYDGGIQKEMIFSTEREVENFLLDLLK